MCATTCTNRLLFPACTPKSYQCSARMPSGPGSLSRGSLRSVVRTSSATSDKKRFATNAWAGAAGSGCAGQRLLISWTICSVTGTGGAFLAAARARLRSPDRASDSLVSLWEDDPKEELKYARGNHCWAACLVSAPDRVEQHACGLGVRFEQSVPPTPLYCHVATASQTQTTGTYRQLQTRNRPKCANPCKTRGRVKGWRIANIWWLARLVNARGPADEREGSGVHQESGDQDQHHHELGAQGTEQPRHPYAEFTSVLNQDSATALYSDQMLNAWSTVQRRRSAHDLQTDLAETIRDALVDAGAMSHPRRPNQAANKFGIIEGGQTPTGAIWHDEWLCKCGTRNFMHKPSCRTCGEQPSKIKQRHGAGGKGREGGTSPRASPTKELHAERQTRHKQDNQRRHSKKDLSVGRCGGNSERTRRRGNVGGHRTEAA